MAELVSPADIGLNRDSGSASARDLRDDRLGLFRGIQVVDDDRRAELRKPNRCSLSDPARGARDDRDPSGEGGHSNQ
jgi:hypothetical protein